uniref:C2H2-type domain-containing protein n=1 Tax=viral metagenome TaxID=1070528 RepID=A0A6C0DKK4_9ZZZZ
MSEFSCEFCKSEFKDKSNLQRHIKTSKKCLSKRTSTEYAKTESAETKSSETKSTETAETADYNRDDLLTKYNEALKELEEKKKELAYVKEEFIKLSKYKDRDNKKKVVYDVQMFCICGMLEFMRANNMRPILDETMTEQFKVNLDKFERDVTITITKKK